MSSFIALNVEPESDSEEEIDDTKEIQIEEALKLYQNALKLHSQGPEFFPQAKDAYDELFNSEVFKYPESISESRRLDDLGESYDDVGSQEGLVLGPAAVSTGGVDGTPSTLPQILYLSFKNHGRFMLDCWLHQVCLDGRSESIARDTIILFGEALERDDTDLDLWQHISKVSAVLGSSRVARFCFEAILENEQEEYGSLAEPLDLEAKVARANLRDLVTAIEDSLSLSVNATLLGEQRQLSAAFRKRMDPCPQLSVPPAITRMQGRQHVDQGDNMAVCNISAPLRTWESLGKAVLQQIGVETRSQPQYADDRVYRIKIPENGEVKSTKPFGSPRGQGAKGDHSSALVLDTNTNKAIEPPSLLTANGPPKGTTASGLPAERIDEQAEITPSGKSLVDGPCEETSGNSDKATGSDVKYPTLPINENDNHKRRVVENHVVATVVRSPNGLPESSPTMSLPTRKRSSEAAGLHEPTDGGRVRSKRIRARADTGPDEEATAVVLARHYEELLRVYTHADHWLFDVAYTYLSKLGCSQFSPLEPPQGTDASSDLEKNLPKSSRHTAFDVCLEDFKLALETWNIEKSNIFLHGADADDLMSGDQGGKNSALTVFLEYSKRGSQKVPSGPVLSGDRDLTELVTLVNNNSFRLDGILTLWLDRMLASNPKKSADETSHPDYDGRQSRYVENSWSDGLKETVVQLLILADEKLFDNLANRLQNLVDRILLTISSGDSHDYNVEDDKMTGLIQTIFELHIDVYGRITNPSSEVDSSTRLLQRDRLGRWNALASQAIGLRSTMNPEQYAFATSTIALRYLWSTVTFVSLVDTGSRDHVVLLFQDLIRIMVHAGSPVIELQNNAAMPELSVEAAEREISRLATVDFFLGIFDAEADDPATVIESLEPILERSTRHDSEARSVSETQENSPSSKKFEHFSTVQPSNSDARSQTSDANNQDIKAERMSDFLDKANTSLRLFLWRKLRSAYEAIQYPPMIFRCFLKSAELMLEEMLTGVYVMNAADKRILELVSKLKTLDSILAKTLSLLMRDSSSLDCMDEDHLRSSLILCSELARMLHVFVIWEDSIRVGQFATPGQGTSSATNALESVSNKLREMHVRVWTLQYILIKEAMSQRPDIFPTPNEDLAEYLKSAHNAFGIRQYCRLSKKSFPKFMKNELLALNASESWETSMAQIIFDIYGLKVFPALLTPADHGCMPESLSKSAAFSILEFFMIQAKTMSVKDLLKSDLKLAAEKMQSVLGIPKSSSHQMFNKRIINAYLKTPVNPIEMYRSLQGIGCLSGRFVINEHSIIARSGWYFLQGHLALTKFRSQKRVSAGSVEDLDTAIQYFRQDLEFDMENWESWYRLAQVYDAKIDDHVTWSADFINNHKAELAALQRNSINCYAMAIAVAVRSADGSFDTADKISDLYSDFGMRIYSSSREPFNMQAFKLDGFARIGNTIQGGMKPRPPFKEFKSYPVWKFASVLFRRALADKPHRWTNHYMLGKCLWKMCCHPELKPEKAPKVTFDDALSAFSNAIRYVPERRDNRHPEKDPILEPHYKTVSIVQKLVQRKLLQPSNACRILESTPYCRTLPSVIDAEDWESYILQILKQLRSVDKSNWHHRMVARAAHIIYDESPDQIMAAAAKSELTQQIFTKTMAIQVWKPENERAGRHFVYTGRYVLFFIRLLSQTGDRSNLEALARRIRKKTGEFIDHATVWSELCFTYVNLLRHQGHVLEGSEELVFKAIQYEEFVLHATRLEAWAHSTDTVSQDLELLKEVIELRKLNNNLIKTGGIDDLLADTFAKLYAENVPNLLAKSNEDENRDRMRVDHLLMNIDQANSEVLGGIKDERGTSAPAHRGRAKTITKREIQKRAESLIVRPQNLPAPSRSGKAFAPTTSTPNPIQPSETLQNQLKSQPLAVISKVKDEDRNKEVASSVPGSVHDSADDESELSDVEGPIERIDPRPPMFPGLLGRGNITDDKAPREDESVRGEDAEMGENHACVDPGEETNDDFVDAPEGIINSQEKATQAGEQAAGKESHGDGEDASDLIDSSQS